MKQNLTKFALMRFFIPLGMEGQKSLLPLCVKLNDGSVWTLMVRTEGQMVPDDPNEGIVNWTLLKCEPLMKEFPKDTKEFEFIAGSKIIGQGRFVP